MQQHIQAPLTQLSGRTAIYSAESMEPLVLVGYEPKADLPDSARAGKRSIHDVIRIRPDRRSPGRHDRYGTERKGCQLDPVARASEGGSETDYSALMRVSNPVSTVFSRLIVSKRANRVCRSVSVTTSPHDVPQKARAWPYCGHQACGEYLCGGFRQS